MSNVKVDVEGHETSVFTEPTASRFFDKIDVRLVFMEWMFVRRHPPRVVERLLNFFRARNYAEYDIRNFKLLANYRHWPDNLLFKKSIYTSYRF